MAEPIKDNVGQKGADGQEIVLPERSELRIKDLTDKLAEKDRAFAVEREEMQKERDRALKEAQESKFDADFAKESAKYPKATDSIQEIRQYVDKGLNVSEATRLVLSGKGDFSTTEEVQKTQVEGSSFGGGATNTHINSEVDFSKMSLEEKHNELIKREQQGDWGFNAGQIYTKK